MLGLRTCPFAYFTARRRPDAGFLHHSDRGCQYASADYRSTLAERDCVASANRRGNCYNNATLQALWSTLKHELIYRRRFAIRDEATTAIFNYIESVYNRTGLHSALGFESLFAYESNLH